ncbi:MAG TPA: hypothetical protein VIY47_08505 [Ignavibacteriaceae bacterium]
MNEDKDVEETFLKLKLTPEQYLEHRIMQYIIKAYDEKILLKTTLYASNTARTP